MYLTSKVSESLDAIEVEFSLKPNHTGASEVKAYLSVYRDEEGNY